jgi:radical SAM superfamily enzyme YgiQ (UPF0313 family)
MNPVPFSALLIYSAPGGALGAPDPWTSFFPMGLGYIQAMLKSRGLACRLANLSGLPKGEIAEYLRRMGPSLVGVSMFTFNRKRSCALVGMAREACPSAVLVAGGPHATHMADEVFDGCPGLDAIVQGEGEAPMLEMARLLEVGGDWRAAPSLRFRDGTGTAMAPPMADLDTIGLPAEHFEADFFGDYTQLGYIATSRGCPSGCSFCGTPAFWGRRVRFRGAGSVLREMRALWRGHGVAYFNVRDDTFTADRGRALEICGEIRADMARGGMYPLWSCQSRPDAVDEERLVAMVRAGCGLIQFGVEHGSPRTLKALGKAADIEGTERALSLVKKVGMNLGVYLITGVPGETMEDVAQSEALLKRLSPHDTQISPLAVYPGTRLHGDMLAAGAIPPDFYSVRDELEIWARPDKSDPAKGNRGYDAFTAKALARLRRAADAAAVRARYTPEDFRRHKKLLGWCHTTNVICGEAAEEAGDVEDAVRQYAEITKKEPQNPWGWLKRGRALLRLGRHRAARADFSEALKLVPKNAEALEGADAARA